MFMVLAMFMLGFVAKRMVISLPVKSIRNTLYVPAGTVRSSMPWNVIVKSPVVSMPVTVG